jgi:hypothetical protein
MVMSIHTSQEDEPQLHVLLDIEKVFETYTPWLAWSCFQHKPSELRMERRCRATASTTFVSNVKEIGRRLLLTWLLPH